MPHLLQALFWQDKGLQLTQLPKAAGGLTIASIQVRSSNQYQLVKTVNDLRRQ